MTAGALILGVVNGLTYGLLALGIVLVYKSNRFLNLAFAQLGAVPALLLAKFVLQWGWSWWVAFPLCVAFGVAVGLLIDWALISRLRSKTRSAVAPLLLTLGVGELLLAVTYVPALGPGPTRLSVQGYPAPFHAHLAAGSVILASQDLLTMVLAPLLVVALAVFFQFSFLGKQVRAAASNPDAAQLAGISIRKTSAITWGVAGALAAVTAILQAPSQGTFNAAVLGPSLLLLALGGAVFGAFTSIPWALAGGLALGVVQQLALATTHNGGTADVVVLMSVLIAVMWRGRAIGEAFALNGAVVAERPSVQAPRALAGRWLVRRWRQLLGVTALFVAVLLPMLPVFRSQSRRFELALVLVYALVAVSLCLLVGWGGQVSLGHVAIVGAGAFVTARLAHHHLSLVAILLAAGVTGAVVLVVVGLPALRVPGLSLAVTTLGLAVIAPDWLFRQRWFGSTQPFGIRVNASRVAAGIPAPTSQGSVYYLGLAVLAIAVLVLAAFRRAGPGRVLIAVRDNEAAAASFGLTPATVKLMALALSGFLAGIAGVVWAESWRSVATTQFTPDLSMAVLAAPVVGGVSSLGGSIAAAVLIYGAMFFVSPALTSVFGSFGREVGFQLALGGAGIVATVMLYPSGVAGAAGRLWSRFLERVATRVEASPGAGSGPATPLVVDDVHVRFGGVLALDGASIRVGQGEIVGLIGPNGAGKSTLMNVISGNVRPRRGSVRAFGQELVGLAPEYRPAFGVGRSYQDARLFPGLTVTEAVQVGAGRHHRVGMLSAAFRVPWARAAERECHAAAREMVDRLGLAAWADCLVADLSTGTRRLCDLAAQAVARPAILLLDEPTAGIAQREVEEFGRVLRRVQQELGCAVLLIEHDMPLLMGLCDRVYAMDAGRVIAEGTPAQVRSDPAVISSYLGTDAVAVARSGRRNGSGAPARTGAAGKAAVPPDRGERDEVKA